ncbi:MAG: hypothetical protein RBT49_10870 [Bacteroidales bacterium]|jgi:hypothetical protein|nr:hypothetical protein [Bacteroidales bacterium]
MKKLLTILVILFTPFFMFAQLSSFDLSSYKLPDLSYHQLDFNLDLNGQNSVTDRKFRVSDDTYLKFNGISGNGNVSYSYYKNTEKLQLDQKVRTTFTSTFSEYKDKETLMNETYGYNGDLNILSENRIYFSTNFFLETSLDFYSGSYYVHQYNAPETQQVQVNEFDVSIPVLTGFGRIEQVQDARLAIYIFDELSKLGKLAKTPTDEEVIQFSQFISKLKKERFFDSRLKNMRDIELIDSVLQSKGLVSTNDAKYYVTLNDQWNYAAQPIRNSGQRISFGINPEIYSSDYQNINLNVDGNTKSYEERFEYALGAGVNYTFEKPINLYWQSSLNFSFFGKYMEGTIRDWPYDISINSPQLESNINYMLGFYPTTRTNIQLSFSAYYFNAFGEEFLSTNEEFKTSHFILQPSSNLLINYYISPKVRLRIDYSINYSYLESNSEYYGRLYNEFLKYNSFNQALRIGFVFKII